MKRSIAPLIIRWAIPTRSMHTVDDSLIELLIADRISLMDAMAHARDSNFVKEEFQKALKSQRKGWFAGVFKK